MIKLLLLFAFLTISMAMAAPQNIYAQDNLQDPEYFQDQENLQDNEGEDALVEETEEAWSKPINLSNSGSASEPRLLVAEDGSMQAFWWDRFDGLTTSTFDEGEWSEPAVVLIPTYLKLEPPFLLLDRSKSVHVFWKDGETNETLMHSQMPMGSASFASPQVVTVSALTFSAAVSPEGQLSVAYFRTRHTPEFPAGVYVKYLEDEETWSPAALVYSSIYIRLLSIEQAHISLTAAGNGFSHLVWETPTPRKAMYAYSEDGGSTWMKAEILGDEESSSFRPRIVSFSNQETIRLWESDSGLGCEIYQQQLYITQIEQTEDEEEEIELELTWGEPKQVLEGLNTCPVNDQFWETQAGVRWVWNLGSSNLTVATYDQENERWSQPRSLMVNFTEEFTQRHVTLSTLQADILDDHLWSVGTDLVTGEVWVVEMQVNLYNFTFSPPPAWNPPRLVARSDQLSAPAMAIDARGFVNIIWSQPNSTERPTRSLYFSRGKAGIFYAPLAILTSRGDEEYARDPNMIIDEAERFHLVWSSSTAGEILYSRALAEEIMSVRNWEAPLPLSGSGFSAWPTIGIDATGNLYVVYVTPYNENRGVYITSSQDGGGQWSEPQQIFDAANAGWQMVDHPTLAVEPDGTLHAAWVRGNIPADWPPSGVFYTRSTDQGKTWEEVQQLAGEVYDWPRLAISNNQVHLLLAGRGGGVWHLWKPIGNQENTEQGWTLPARVPGWERVAAPFGMAVDGTTSGGTLHLTGAAAYATKNGNSSLLYTTWNGSSWKQSEIFSPTTEVGAGLGAASVTRTEGGALAVAWISLSETDGQPAMPSMFLTVRTIPHADLTESIAIEEGPPPITEAIPLEPEEMNTPVPTPTPDLNLAPARTNLAVSPMMIGGSLAAVALMGIFGLRALWGKRR